MFISRNISYKLLLTIIYLDRNRNLENKVGLTIKDLITESGYQFRRGGDNKNTIEFKEQLQFLCDNEMIGLLKRDSLPILPSDFFRVEVLNDFNIDGGFVMLTAHEIDTLFSISGEKSKIFGLYLYIKSFIFQKPRQKDTDTSSDLRPSAFFSDIRSVAPNTGLSADFVNKYIDKFVSLGLFKKKIVGSYFDNQGNHVNAPNIYVENNKYADEEINLALDRLKFTYQVEDFLPMLKRNKRTNLKQ